jgi:NAD(P)H-hydrate repair Nnr-like enzyme with NAD(P)H-hydrate epimerase domain
LLNIPFLEEMPSASEIKAEYDIILDGIFGFSFTGELRQPFKDIIEANA